MATTEVTVETLPEILEQNEIVLLDFWAVWCLPCLQFAPTFEAASEAEPQAFFGKVDTDQQQELAAVFGILSVPTLVVFREKQIVFRKSGVPSAEQLTDILAQVRALDMNTVHAEVANQK